MHVALTPTMADLCRPQRRLTGVGYDVALIFAGSVLIVLCSRLSLTLPFNPLVPVTAQTFAVLLVGALLGAKRGALAVVVFLAEGLGGVPVSATGIAGPMWLLGPTGGYAVGFVPAAFVAGLLAQRGWDRRFGRTIGAMTIGTALIFLHGLLWLAIQARLIAALAIADVDAVSFSGLPALLDAGLWPYLPGAAVKIGLAAVVLPFGWKVLAWCGGDPSPRHRDGA